MVDNRTREYDLVCAACSGNGFMNGDTESEDKCPECDGSGTVSPYHRYEHVDPDQEHDRLWEDG